MYPKPQVDNRCFVDFNDDVFANTAQTETFQFRGKGLNFTKQLWSTSSFCIETDL